MLHPHPSTDALNPRVGPAYSQTSWVAHTGRSIPHRARIRGPDRLCDAAPNVGRAGPPDSQSGRINQPGRALMGVRFEATY